MITLLGSLLGFGTSFLPEVLNFFKAGQEHKHNLERMALEMDMMTKRNELKLNIIDKQAEIKETEVNEESNTQESVDNNLEIKESTK